MKLPENKKERIQAIALIAIGVIFVIYIGISYAVKPLLRNKAERLTRIEKIKSEITKVKQIEKLITLSRENNNKVVSNILDISETENYILKPRLGNYLISASEIIEAALKEEELSVESVKENGISDIPVLPGTAPDSTNSPFRLYTASVSLKCGIHDLVRLLENIERRNPYIGISEIQITEQVPHSARHTTSFNVQWPIWREPAAVDNIIKSAETESTGNNK